MQSPDSSGIVTGGLVSIAGAEHYRIDGIEQMEPFLTTVVSDSDLWMFISSTGALTAGRVDADHALFPYETDDRLHRAAGITGPVTVIAHTVEGRRELWRPFANEPTPGCPRSIAKTVLGDRLVLEERNPAWGLEFRATWAPSAAHGWVRAVELVSRCDLDVEYEVLDGLLDVMPAGVDASTEQIRSNLVNAYKRSEAGPCGTLAVYSLESLITDRAEPAESLTANIVWSTGFADAELDLDARSVRAMIEGHPSTASRLVTGRPGAYLLRGSVVVPRSGSASWRLVADAGLAQPEVADAATSAAGEKASQHLDDEIDLGSNRLRDLLHDADAFQTTADPIADAHHVSNVLFNSMRGGVFPEAHRVSIVDLVAFVEERNSDVAARQRPWLDALGEWVDAGDLRTAALATDDHDVVRLVLEYLPLTFSRRHGDPSRPWNRFSINVRDDDGRQLLAYEGNWRDIFQNWEALLQSYPAYFPHVVAKFVNASTIDGYNPYRISRDGIDWEVPDPDDPWSHIGYWGDHQIVYLLRLLESWERFDPGAIGKWLGRPVFSYADVPYAIADHDAIVDDPRNTITYDEDRAAVIEGRVERVGSDGRLLVDEAGSLISVGLAEKLIVPALGKLTNFVPGGGIWLTTQRPEWNDANNALAGPGLSMVTLYHLHRYVRFVGEQLGSGQASTVTLSTSVASWLSELQGVLDMLPVDVAEIDDRQRRTIVDALGLTGEAHRHRVGSSTTGETVDVPLADVRRLCDASSVLLSASIEAARRDDGLFHSYNRISFPSDDTARVDHLGPMLEGQVAVLSSAFLDPEESLAVVDALFESGMYRPDQNTFVLYPVTELPSFLDRNVVPDDAVSLLEPLGGALGDRLRGIFTTDLEARVRFRAGITNAADLVAVLDHTPLSGAEREVVLGVHEQVFHHHSFTGRSGSMYGYEGIGSVYWHMVAKLLLAVQETYWWASDAGAPSAVVDALADRYRRIRAGLGFCKGPVEFGAIPTDCYSHTPAHAGAQQPGMTGQVKEELLTRFGELGLRVLGGRLSLSPPMLAADQVVPAGSGTQGSARFTFCAVPLVVSRGDADRVTIFRADGEQRARAGLALSRDESAEVFERRGTIERIEFTVAG